MPVRQAAPVSHTEFSHVCLWKVEYGTGRQALELVTPFDDATLSLRLDFLTSLPTGTYQYATVPAAGDPSLNIDSNSTLFWTSVGSNTLAPSDVTLTIIESDTDRLSGSYAFTGQDQGDYSGDFEILFAN